MVAIARAFAAHGCDLIDVSTGQTVADAAPVYGRMFQVPFSDMIRNETGLATMCVGSITSADQVNTILAAGRADLVALARPHLVDAGFAMRAAAEYGVTDIACPVQYEYRPRRADAQRRPRTGGPAWTCAGGRGREAMAGLAAASPPMRCDAAINGG